MLEKKRVKETPKLWKKLPNMAKNPFCCHSVVFRTLMEKYNSLFFFLLTNNQSPTVLDGTFNYLNFFTSDWQNDCSSFALLVSIRLHWAAAWPSLTRPRSSPATATTRSPYNQVAVSDQSKLASLPRQNMSHGRFLWWR